MGDRVSTQDLKWQAWPKEAATQGYITKSAKPKAMADYDKAIARTGVLQGEPISEGKFVRCSEDPNKKVQCEGGAMAAILPSGMRAIAVKISEETSAGRFILPNDMVDVILTRRMRTRGAGGEDFVSDTLFQNVRVLAIGQNLETKDGKKTVDGGTTTLELTPAQSEQLVLAKSMGEIVPGPAQPRGSAQRCRRPDRQRETWALNAAVASSCCGMALARVRTV